MVDYSNPPPVEANTDDFRSKLSEDRLVVSMTTHCPSEVEARQVVEPFLRAWETDAFLRSGNHDLHFEFVDSHLIDRNPPAPGEPQVIQLSGLVSSSSLASATLVVSKKEYPKPPRYSSLSPDAQTLASRYQGYREGKEPLLAMAYFCLTVVESRAGNRSKAARLYDIDKDVLSKLGELTSKRGDENSARKYDPQSKPLSSQEQTWVDFAVRCIAVQVANVDAGNPVSTLAMSTLPDL